MVCQEELKNCESQVDSLKLASKETNEKYEKMLEDARNEIDSLKSTVDSIQNEFENSKAGWEQKELHLMGCVKKSEEENSSSQEEVSRLVNLLKESEEDACARKIGRAHV